MENSVAEFLIQQMAQSVSTSVSGSDNHVSWSSIRTGDVWKSIEEADAKIQLIVRDANDPIADFLERKTGMKLDREIFANEMVLAPWTFQRVMRAACKAEKSLAPLESIVALAQWARTMEEMQKKHWPREQLRTGGSLP